MHLWTRARDDRDSLYVDYITVAEPELKKRFAKTGVVTSKAARNVNPMPQGSNWLYSRISRSYLRSLVD